jgi:serine/threonine protein phosphatase PrpC
MSQYKIQYKIEAGTGQHIGNRSEQHDRVTLMTTKSAPGYVLAALADGLSGHQGGKMAAEQVMHTIKQLFDMYNPQRTSLTQLLHNIVSEAHTMIKLLGISSKSDQNSTLVILVLSPEGQAIWAHVGDSRLYRFQGKQFIDHTSDEAYIESLLLDGKLSREAAKNHRKSAILVNALGSNLREPFITIGEQSELAPGMSFLLCSDGLWHYFADNELGAAVSLKTPREASEMLIEKAQERAKGNGDNCSLVIVKLVKLPEEDLGYKVEKLRRAV